MATAPTTRVTRSQFDGTRQDLSVDEALHHIVQGCSPLPPCDVALADALGLTLAENVTARCDLPPFTNSAMDGFAVRSADTAAARPDAPLTLTVLGGVAAGSVAACPVQPGGTLRIMTGAPLPTGADAVVRVEDVETAADPARHEAIVLRQPVPPGDNVRPAGEDMRLGDVVLPAGATLDAAAIGLLAATGHQRVRVHRRPRVGILVTGDEIVAPGAPLPPGKIWNSNGPMMAAQIRQSGGEPVVLGVAGDTPAAVRAGLDEAANLDLIVTTGGVSVGDYDVVKEVLRQEGRIEIWKLRMKPGKPLAFGWIGPTPVIGLPGNPVAAAVAGWQFVYPAIQRMLGRPTTGLRTVPARLLDTVPNKGNRRQFVRVAATLGPDGYVARVAGAQGSHILTSLTRGNGLLVIPETCPVAEPGMTFDVQLLPPTD